MKEFIPVSIAVCILKIQEEYMEKAVCGTVSMMPKKYYEEAYKLGKEI